MSRTALIGIVLGATIALLNIGCEKSPAPGGQVQGKVTYKGAPVANARVIFSEISANDAVPQEYVALSDEMGIYNLTGGDVVNRAVKPGEYAVRIYQLVSKDGKPLPPEMDAEQLEASGMGKNALPAIYASKTKSPLKAIVKEGPNEIDFNLDGK
jgi:hypothetical protein